jgi:hypothetical protein
MASSKIVVDTFNGIQSKIASILGAPDQSIIDLGYDLTYNSSQVTRGAVIYGDDANKAIGDINTIVQHQTGTPTSLPIFSKGQVIYANDLAGLSSAVDSAYTSRNTVGSQLLAVVNSDSYSSGGTWGVQRTHTVTLDWGSNNNFRGWTNLGGFIVIGASTTGGSGTALVNSWETLLSAAGNIVFSGDAAFQNNKGRDGSFPNGGLYNLIQNGQVGAYESVAFKLLDTDAHYTGNSFQINITPYPSGTGVFACTGFTVTAILNNPYTSEPNASPPTDIIDSTFNWSINTYYCFNKTPNAINVSSTVS